MQRTKKQDIFWRKHGTLRVIVLIQKHFMYLIIEKTFTLEQCSAGRLVGINTRRS